MWWAVTQFFDYVSLGSVPAALLSVVASWSTWFKGIVAFLGSAAAAVFWTLIGRHVVCWLEWWWCGLLSVMFGTTLPYITAVLKVLPAFPTFPADVWSAITQAWLISNYYFPVNECVVGAFVVSLLIAVIRGLRFVKQFIPTASN